MQKNINSMKRFERKWVFDNNDYNQIYISLYRSNFYFIDHFPDRQVNSIYFDDQHHSSIVQNIDGISDKKKYRLRWYGNFKNIKDPVFEVKKKNGFEVSKDNFSLPKLNNLNLFKNDDIDFLASFINDNFNFTNKLFPILTTHYLRSYFISSNKLVRATIDRNLKSLILYQNKNSDIIKEFNDIILELKYDLNLDNYVRQNLGSTSVRLSKNSKFINSATVTPDTLT